MHFRTIASVFLLMTAYGFPGTEDDEVKPASRVKHFALVCCGSTHGSEQHKKWYWSSNERISKMLHEVYGYPQEAIYRLYEEGNAKDPDVDGCSSLVNLRKVFKHLAKIMKKDDHLLVYLVGHGGPNGDDYVYDMIDGRLTGKELGRMLDDIRSRNIVIILNPCHSGGFVPALSGKGRVICTSTSASEGNAAGWEGYMTRALAKASDADRDGDGRVSLKEAYNASVQGTMKWYEKKGYKLDEHPLLDDNGDGKGHFGKEPLVEGDGDLASRTYLGAEGRTLKYKDSALKSLARINRKLKLD